MKTNLLVWFEIPVLNIERAKEFYDNVFDISIAIHDLGGLKMGWFPNVPEKPGATGSLMQHESYIPSTSKGPLLYFSSKDVAIELARITNVGGEILKEKTLIGEGHGYMALFKDSEGNRIALHSPT